MERETGPEKNAMAIRALKGTKRAEIVLHDDETKLNQRQQQRENPLQKGQKDFLKITHKLVIQRQGNRLERLAEAQGYAAAGRRGSRAAKWAGRVNRCGGLELIDGRECGRTMPSRKSRRIVCWPGSRL